MPEYDMFTPCPGCGEVGTSLMVFEGTEDGEIQLMDCSKPRSECRVAEYYPERVSDE
jgi:hypothetical protein